MLGEEPALDPAIGSIFIVVQVHLEQEVVQGFFAVDLADVVKHLFVGKTVVLLLLLVDVDVPHGDVVGREVGLQFHKKFVLLAAGDAGFFGKLAGQGDGLLFVIQLVRQLHGRYLLIFRVLLRFASLNLVTIVYRRGWVIKIPPLDVRSGKKMWIYVV